MSTNTTSSSTAAASTGSRTDKRIPMIRLSESHENDPADNIDEEQGNVESKIMYTEEFLPSASSATSSNNSTTPVLSVLKNESTGRILRRKASYPTVETDRNRTQDHTRSMIPAGNESGSRKFNVLALHGKASNGDVTRMQLANLGIACDLYDIICLNGPIYEEEGDPDVTELVNGPFYSWYHGNFTDARFQSSFYNAIISVLSAIENLGPFDAMYGFSQGAVVASFAALAFTNQSLKERILSYAEEAVANGSSSGGRMKTSSSLMMGQSFWFDRNSRNSRQSSFHMKLSGSLQHSLRTRYLSTQTAVKRVLHQDINTSVGYMVIACPVVDVTSMIKALGLDQNQNDFKIFIPSMQLIGINDPKKMISEKFGSIFTDLQVRYMTGGHAVTRVVSSDASLMRTLKQNIHLQANVVEISTPEMKKISDISRMGLMSSIQVAHVELDYNKMHDTLIAAISSKDRDKPLFYEARNPNENVYTSYGDVLDFIHGGDGDLRRLGVQQGEVVAYVAPPGGSKYFYVKVADEYDFKKS